MTATRKKTRLEKLLGRIAFFIGESILELRNNLLKAGTGGAVIGFLVGIIISLSDGLDFFNLIQTISIAAGIGCLCAVPIAIGSTIIGIIDLLIERVYPPLEDIVVKQTPKALETFVYFFLLLTLATIGQFGLEFLVNQSDNHINKILEDINLLEWVKPQEDWKYFWVNFIILSIISTIGAIVSNKERENQEINTK